MGRIASIRLTTVRRPMRTTFATALGTKKAATSVLVDVRLAGGAGGAGEVPTSFVLPHETVEAIKKVLITARRSLVGAPIEDYPSLLSGLRATCPEFHMTWSGLEVALFRAWLAARGQSETAWWGGRGDSVTTDITIPFIPGDPTLPSWLARALAGGFDTYKVKVSGQVDADMAFVRHVRGVLGDSGRAFTIRLDGNQGYTPRTYRRMLKALAAEKIAVELFEQPLHKDDLSGLKQIRGLGGVPVVVDETVFDSAQARRVIDEGLADGINIKLAKSGIAESRRIMTLTRQAGLKLMIGCMTETMVGLSAGICMAAGTAAFDFVDLDSVHFLFHRDAGAIRTRGPRFEILNGPPAGRASRRRA